MPRVFLLSPASCTGRRAEMLLAERAAFPLAHRVRDGTAPIGEIFTFLSGLYFRGKLTYALRFARPPARARLESGGGILVITPAAGLVPAAEPLTRDRLREFARVDIHPANRMYRAPLEATARTLAGLLGSRCEVVLLGSVASSKYVDILGDVFGRRLVFPSAFVGRGDMSRGGLLLRCAAAGAELDYVPVAGALRHGPRPPRLEPLRKAVGLHARGTDGRSRSR